MKKSALTVRPKGHVLYENAERDLIAFKMYIQQ